MRLNGCLKFRRYGPARRLFRITLILTLVWFIAEIYSVHRSLTTTEPSAVQAHAENNGGRIFIASLHWNNEAILRSDWNDAVVQLVSHLGTQNVFVSVYESGSWDDSKGALRELDARLDALGAPRNITLSEVTHQDEISAQPAAEGWINTSRGGRELRRIPYLARLRNWSLEILGDLARQGVTFDTILFLNDVVFTTQDVLTLLDTNGGSYAAACSLDFSKPPLYYDTFALRDSHGDEPLMQTWPYFRSSESLDALLSMSPVPVTSCWNGMVAMPTAPFLLQSNSLRFRGIPDSLALHHLEGSECCLIHADNPFSSTHGVFLNPRVRVGYNRAAYEAVHPPATQNWVSPFSPSFSLTKIVLPLWENRLRRWFSTPFFWRRAIRRRVERWEEESDVEFRYEPGEFCLVDEMQVLVSNGWAHV